MSRRGGALGGLVACLLTALPALPVAAQGDLDVVIREAVLDDDGSTTVTVSVTGSAVDDEVPADAFGVTEDGAPIDALTVTSLQESADPDPVAVMLVVDVSRSTEGDALDNAKAAATDFVGSVIGPDTQVGLVSFASTATLLVAPTSDAAALTDAIADLEVGEQTSLYDAVVVGARALQNFDAQRSMVVFSDGADTSSSAALGGAVEAAQLVDAAVSTVALQTEEFDVAPLEQLADTTGGRLLPVSDADALQDAFGQVAQALTSQYVISYDSTATAGDELDLAVTLALGGATATDQARVVSPRTQAAAGEPRVVATASNLFTQDAVLYGALAAGFLGLLLFLFVLLVPRGDRRVSQTLARGLRFYNREGDRAAPTDATTRLAASSVTRGAVKLVSRVPRPKGYDERIQLKLDRASWPLRATEFTAARVGAFLLGLLVGWGLFASLPLGLMAGVILGVVPGFLLDGRVAARQNKFLAQLPDTLTLLAGALKAGYGILQAIDTVVKESPEPTASEFSRVLTESRLGLPLEDSLEAMADRLGSEDFRWVVVAINIQRRVGGNLAELLDTVAETLREREMVRRQIKTLSAEGKLSAIILVAMPFVIAAYLFVVNPDYLGILFERTIGNIMLGGAVVLMGLGIYWMSKLIDIDV